MVCYLQSLSQKGVADSVEIGRFWSGVPLPLTQWSKWGNWWFHMVIFSLEVESWNLQLYMSWNLPGEESLQNTRTSWKTSIYGAPRIYLTQGVGSSPHVQREANKIDFYLRIWDTSNRLFSTKRSRIGHGNRNTGVWKMKLYKNKFPFKRTIALPLYPLLRHGTWWGHDYGLWYILEWLDMDNAARVNRQVEFSSERWIDIDQRNYKDKPEAGKNRFEGCFDSAIQEYTTGTPFFNHQPKNYVKH